ncbi:hypothetical protein SAMN05421837_110107 [Amycolatopsis pretoriensis]|uniref:Uncharacterized protein n=1 Tax=Amycolatopsis pretoriensis TaxID=218821 RepID=A0A1H5RDB4_9PSEU|nr:hypothetical protein SAMN05421837_110107 [Amycolatopsis pretoriensis]
MNDSFIASDAMNESFMRFRGGGRVAPVGGG